MKTIRLAAIALLPFCAPFARADQRVPTLSINDVALTEDSCQGKNFVFTVTLSKLATNVVTVHYATADGSPSGSGTAAVANKDYVPVSGMLTFTHDTAAEGPNGSYLLTITVPLGNYVVSSGSNDGRAFTVMLSGATNATIGQAQGVGTLLDAALSCAPAENAGCFVNYCGATRSCKNVNRSACAMPFCAIAGFNGPPDANFNACNAAGLWADSDGDGLSDTAEAQGYIDVNCDGVYDPGIDVPLPGADPHKPDVYVHYDYVVASDHTHNPPPQALEWMVQSFAGHGVNLHFDPQHNAICENAGDAGCITVGTGARVVSVTGTGKSCGPSQPCAPGTVCSGGQCILDSSCSGPSAASNTELRQQTNFGLKALAYRYMVFGHFSSCDNASDCVQCPADPECGGGSPPPANALGDAEIFGDDAIVSLGPYVDSGRSIPVETIAAISMHEFGHNLGLFHGGSTCDNLKPNYLSVMSFNFDTIGIPVAATPGSITPITCTTDADCVTPHASGAHCSPTTHSCLRIDYSDHQCNDLNECATNGGQCLANGINGVSGGLNETIGLQCGADDTDISVFTTDGLNTIFIPTNGSPIDWNLDGTATELHVSQDINGDGARTLLTAYNDWANLGFNYQCGSNFADAFPCGQSVCSNGQTCVKGKCQ